MTPTLLFLEEDLDLQRQVTPFLKERGVHVECARSAAEAREVLARTRLDAAVVDGLLPDMTGADFIAELRRTHPTLPVLFASAFRRDLKSHERLTGELQVTRVLHKPYGPAELWQRVQELLAPPAPPPPQQQHAPLMDEREVAQALAALTAEYAGTLPGRFAALAAALAAARSGTPGAAAALGEALALAHKLHGTAGSYGFDAVSAVAARLEALLRRMGAGEPGGAAQQVPGDSWREADALYAELVRAARPGA